VSFPSDPVRKVMPFASRKDVTIDDFIAKFMFSARSLVISRELYCIDLCHYGPNDISGLIEQRPAAVTRLNGCRDLHHARIVTDSGDGSDIPKREVTARRQEPMKWKAEDSDAFAKPHAST
jgi:hypothetical protein